MGQLGNISPEGSVAIGILVGLLSTSIQSLGLTLQRQSHLREEEKIAPETRKPAYKRPRWQAGMLMFVVSNLVGSTIQITTLPLPVLSTLQASGLVFNTAFATLLLKEPFTRYALIGTILTCSGAALIAVFGAVAEPAHNLQQLLDLMGEEGFVIWMAATMLVVVVTIVFSHFIKVYTSYKHMSRYIQKQERSQSRSRSNSELDRSTELRSRRLSITAQLPQPLQLKVSRLKFVRGLSYALISGILSAHSLLVAKSAVELLVRTIVDHNNQFNRFQSWLILIALVFFALSQLYYLHLGLRLCSTSVLYPFVFCIYNIVAILDGLIYFQQASRLPVWHAVLVAVGTVILLSGVLSLSWRLDDQTPMEPATQIVPPRNSLTPGMGMLSHSDELERSPLLGSLRSSTDHLPSIDERTPLFARPARRTTLTRTTISPGGAGTRDIWAELDDEEDTYDFLASLPRSTTSPASPKPHLQLPKNRRASLPSQGNHTTSTTAADTKQRRQTLHEYSKNIAQDTAAKISDSPLSSSPANINDIITTRPTTSTAPAAEPPTASDLHPHSTSTSANPSTAPSPTQSKHPRDRRVTVHFEESNLRETSPRRTRRDEAKSPKRSGTFRGSGGGHSRAWEDESVEDPG